MNSPTDFVFPRTERGNDSADHADDTAYGAAVKALVAQSLAAALATPAQQEPEELVLPEPISFAALSQSQPKPMAWLWHQMIPQGTVTSLYGKGGIGKSTIAMVLADAMAGGVPTFGLGTRKCRSLLLLSEDDLDEVHRRVHRLGLRGEDALTLPAGVMNDGDDADPALMRFDARTGAPVLTDKARALEAVIAKHKPDLVVLDPISLIFGGNENDRPQVTSFISWLRSLCAKHGITILLLGHPAKSDDSHYSGSTAWDSAVRSRLFVELKGDQLHVRRVKANYAKAGEDALVLEWDESGRLHAVSMEMREGRAAAEAEARARHADDLVVRFVGLRAAEKMSMPNQSRGASSVYRLLEATERDWLGDFTSAEVEQAVRRCLDAGRIVEATYRRSGRKVGSVLSVPGIQPTWMDCTNA